VLSGRTGRATFGTFCCGPDQAAARVTYNFFEKNAGAAEICAINDDVENGVSGGPREHKHYNELKQH
jgi:hypothetical protein